MIIQLPIDQLYPHPLNPRKDIGDLTELTESIKTNGILQNLTVVEREAGGYTVIIGHRRREAAKLAGRDTAPCVITDMDERKQLATMLEENIQRSDLTVYEQAKGFQMMLDLGSTVDEIMSKTGLSRATVNRRIKMNELDDEKLKAVSSRQINLSDFDRLAMIEDVEARNRILDTIGTRDFEWAIRNALSDQERERCRPAFNDLIKEKGLKEMKQSERYSSKFEHYGYIRIADCKHGQMPQIDSKATHYYETVEGAEIFRIRPAASKTKRSPEELEREAAIAKAHKDIAKCAETMYELRRQFIRNLRVGKGNISNILQGAIYVATLNTRIYLKSTDGHKDYYEVLGVVTDDLTLRAFNENNQIIFNRACEKGIEIAAIAIYDMFGDSVDEKPSSSFIGAFPEHKYNWKLDALYRWLELLGYEMSTIERELMNGTHEVFRRGDQYKIQEETV